MLVKCNECGKYVKKRLRDIKTNKRHFCNKQCYLQHIQTNFKNSCSFCSKLFKTSGRKQKHCSRTCANKARTGIKYNGLNLNNDATTRQRQRSKVMERDGDNCKICNLSPLWQNKPLKLQLDHIDGNRKNENPDNHRLLCPNCHTQTPTWRRRKYNPKAGDGTRLEPERG